MKVMKKLTAVFFYIANSVQMIVSIIQGILTIGVGVILFMVGIMTLTPGLLAFMWVAIFLTALLFLLFLLNIVFGLVLGKKRWANIISVILCLLVIALTAVCLLMNPAELGSESGLLTEENIDTFNNLTRLFMPFLIVHCVCLVIYLLKVIFNKKIEPKQELDNESKEQYYYEK